MVVCGKLYWTNLRNHIITGYISVSTCQDQRQSKHQTNWWGLKPCHDLGSCLGLECCDRRRRSLSTVQLLSPTFVMTCVWMFARLNFPAPPPPTSRSCSLNICPISLFFVPLFSPALRHYLTFLLRLWNSRISKENAWTRLCITLLLIACIPLFNQSLHFYKVFLHIIIKAEDKTFGTSCVPIRTENRTPWTKITSLVYMVIST